MNDVNEKKVLELLKKQFGIDDFDFKIRFSGKNKIYVYKECNNEDLGIELYHFGLYFGRLEKDGLRLSLDGSQLIAKKAKKGVLEISDKEAQKWMKGENITRKGIFGYVIIKWGNYILGCGKGNGKVINNFLPKDRRIS